MTMPGITVKAPATLNLGLIGTGIGALTALVSAVLLQMQGPEILRPLVNDLLVEMLGSVPADSSALVGSVLQEGFDTLWSRALIGTVFAALTLVFALLARGGKGWARFVAVLFALVAMGIWILGLSDAAPTSIHALEAIGLVATLTGLVALFLPASGRYIKARKGR